MQAHTESFRLVERQPRSRAMFFGAITGFLNSVLPKVAPILGKAGPLLGQLLGGAGGGATAGAGGEKKQLSDEELSKVFLELVKLLGAGQKDPAKAQAISQALCAARDDVEKAAQAVKYSQATFWQALLNPETLKAAGEAIKGLLEAADKSDQAFKQHMRDLVKGVDDPALDKLLESMSLSTAEYASDVRFKHVPSVTVSLAGLPRHQLAGRERVLFRHGSDLALPIRVEAPKPIRDATLLIAFKDVDSLEYLVRRAIKLPALTPGALTPVPRLAKTSLGRLQPGREVLLCATLVWKNKQGQRIGAGFEQRLTVVGELAFDRVEEVTELVPLADSERFRGFWHKAWQETFTDEVRRYEPDSKYYFSLDPARAENGRLETLVQAAKEKNSLWKETGRLKAGLVLALPALAALAPALGRGAPALTAAELEALRAPDFAARLALAARHKLELKGRPGDSAALWVYPEIKLQKVVLKKTTNVGEDGWVTRLEDHAVQVPMPALVHFVGTSSNTESAAVGSPVLNGQKVVFDQKVALYPVHLEARKPAGKEHGRDLGTRH